MAECCESRVWGQIAVAMILTGLLLVMGCGGQGETGGGGNEVASADVARGQELYVRTCSMCHGIQGEGVQRLGKSLRDSAFVRQQEDADLVQFLIEGRGPDHPDNTQGIAMPPRGGNPSLSDGDLGLIVAYLRTIS